MHDYAGSCLNQGNKCLIYGFLVGSKSGTLDMQQLTFQRSVGTDHWKKRMNISVFEPRQEFREDAKLRKGSLSYYTDNFESSRKNRSVSLWRIMYSPKAASRFTSSLFGQSYFSTGSNILNLSNRIKLGNSSYKTMDNAGLLRRIRGELARVLRGPCSVLSQSGRRSHLAVIVMLSPRRFEMGPVGKASPPCTKLKK